MESATRTAEKLRDLGFTIDTGVTEKVLETMIPVDVQENASLSDEDVKKLAPVFLSKAADRAVIFGRKEIKKEDLEALQRFCLPGIFCWKSLLLGSKKIGGILLTSQDNDIMQEIGIGSPDELLTISAENIVNRYLSYLRTANRNFVMKESAKELLAKRVNIWKIEAELLSEQSAATAV